MSDKPITGSSSPFCGLFGGQQTEKEKEDYLRRLEEAQRWLVAWEAAESALNQKAEGWIN